MSCSLPAAKIPLDLTAIDYVRTVTYAVYMPNTLDGRIRRPAKHRHPHLLLRDRRIRRRVKQEFGLMVMGASQRKLAVVWGNQ